MVRNKRKILYIITIIILLCAGSTSALIDLTGTYNFGVGGNSFNQNLNTTDGPTFTTVNTGQGDNELYDMDQNVLTTSDVTFNSIAGDGGALTIPWLNNTFLELDGSNANQDINISSIAGRWNFSAWNIESWGDITATDDISGDTGYFDDVAVNDNVYHYGDTNTRIIFDNDEITLRVGGTNVIEITPWETSIDHNLTVESNITTTNLTATNNISANYYYGNGTYLTGITVNHGNLAGLSDDDHSQYLLLAGRNTQNISDEIRIEENLTIGNNYNTNNTITFDGDTNDGVITWLENEDTFNFSCNLEVSDSIFGNGSGLTLDWLDLYHVPNSATTSNPFDQDLNSTNDVTFSQVSLDSDERLKDFITELPSKQVISFCENYTVYLFRWNATNYNSTYINVGTGAQSLYTWIMDSFDNEDIAGSIVHKGNNTDTWTVNYQAVNQLFIRYTQIQQEQINNMESFLKTLGYDPSKNYLEDNQ